MRDQLYRPKAGDCVEFVSLAEVDASYPARIIHVYVNRTRVDIQWIRPNGHPGGQLVDADASRILRQIEEPEREACPVEEEQAWPDESKVGELTMTHMIYTDKWRIEVRIKKKRFVVFVSDTAMGHWVDVSLPCELGIGFETLVGDESDA